MKFRRWYLGLAVAWVGACASAPDHFYTLNAVPAAGPPSSAPTRRVSVHVELPSLVDRTEMVVNTSGNDILILDHERWAAPLSDQVQETLSRDLEARRGDVFVGDRRFDRAATPPITIKVQVVRMTAERGGQASIDARWRIIDQAAGIDLLGGGAFTAAVAGADYAGVARAYSEALDGLAARLAADLPRAGAL